jgi:hypothetical protein
MFDVTFPCRVKGRTKAASPILALPEELDNLFRVWASLAPMTLLMMLVKRVGTPKAAIAAWFRAGIFSPTLVELVLVSLPVIFSLETCLTRRAPVNILLASRGRLHL